MDEFKRFRKLLDDAGIPWEDMSEILFVALPEYCPEYFANKPRGIYRTHSVGYQDDDSEKAWSCIWGFGTYGSEDGLLELMVGTNEPIGHLTADEAFDIVLYLEKGVR